MVATVLMALVVALALAPAPPVSAASADGFLQRLSGFGQTELVFAVAGDPQGREEVWSQVVKALNSVSPAPKFTLLLGDLVASGTEPQYKAFADSAKALKMPFYAVPGNHDIRGDGAALFRRYVSDKLYYSFEEGGYKFIGLNTGDGQVDAEQMQWLQKELAGGRSQDPCSCTSRLRTPRPGRRPRAAWQGAGRRAARDVRFVQRGRGVQRTRAHVRPARGGRRALRHLRRCRRRALRIAGGGRHVPFRAG